jgi:hypothetical protein
MRSRNHHARRIDEIPDDPLDVDEQDEITKSLTHEASAQMKELSDIFGIICALAVIGCLIIAVAVVRNLSGRIHAVVASVLHFAARHLSSRAESSQLVTEGFLIGMCLLPILLSWRDDESDSGIHWSLSLGNLLTTVAAIFLQRDHQSTSRAILDLHGAKYRYKSL